MDIYAANLNHMNNLRHNLEMLRVCSDNFTMTAVATEMAQFNRGSVLLAEQQYEEFVNWFLANTSHETQAILAKCLAETLTEIQKGQNP